MSISAPYTSGTNYTDITEVHYAAIIREVVDTALWATTVCKKLCKQEDITMQNSKGLQFNFWDAEDNAAALTETQDLTSTTMTMSSVTINAAEAGKMTILTDWLLENSFGPYREVTVYGEQLGKTIGQKIDADITTLFSALNSGTAAGTGSGDSQVHGAIAKATYLLEANNASRLNNDTLAAVLHPVQTYHLKTVILARTAVVFQDWSTKKEMLYGDSNGYSGTFLGVDLFNTTQVEEVTKAYRGALIVPGETFGYVQKRGVRPFTERDESARATEVGATIAYGVGELRDLAGIPISTEATA